MQLPGSRRLSESRKRCSYGPVDVQAIVRYVAFMRRARLDEDVTPLSQFRANVSTFVRRIRKTKRPVVLTQRGHSAAVILDVSEYEQLLEEVETLRDIHLAEKQVARGKGVSHLRARTRVSAVLRR